MAAGLGTICGLAVETSGANRHLLSGKFTILGDSTSEPGFAAVVM